MIQAPVKQVKSKQRDKRLIKEEQKVVAKKDSMPEHFLYLGPVLTNEGKNLEKWQFKFSGKKGTPFEGGFYDVMITFPSDYPNVAPKLQFMNDFKHMHVYLSGDICLPLIDQLRWQMNTSIYDIACAIFSMIHGKPNPLDRASDQMRDLFQTKPNGEELYWNHIKEQAQKFKQYENYLIQ